MAMWRVQSGPRGELEDAIARNAVALPWYELPDLSKITTKENLTTLYRQFHVDLKPQQITVAVGQIWAFLQRIQIGDWVVMPLKRHAAVAVGTVESGYEYRSDLGKYLRHIRRVKWVHTEIPRCKFEQDLLFSFRGIMAVCQLNKNEAEVRIKAIAGSDGLG
jgi:restriction system protein